MGIKLYPRDSYVYVFQSEYITTDYEFFPGDEYDDPYVGVDIYLSLPSLPVDAIALNKPLVFKNYNWGDEDHAYAVLFFQNTTSKTVTVTLTEKNSSRTEVLVISPGVTKTASEVASYYEYEYTIEVAIDYDTSLVVPYCLPTDI